MALSSEQVEKLNRLLRIHHEDLTESEGEFWCEMVGTFQDAGEEAMTLSQVQEQSIDDILAEYE